LEKERERRERTRAKRFMSSEFKADQRVWKI
jgi:hypothetical protein